MEDQGWCWFQALLALDVQSRSLGSWNGMALSVCLVALLPGAGPVGEAGQGVPAWSVWSGGHPVIQLLLPEGQHTVIGPVECVPSRGLGPERP